MGNIGAKLGIDFIVSTGDNFYKDGLTGLHDPVSSNHLPIFTLQEAFKNLGMQVSHEINYDQYPFHGMLKIL